MTNFLGGRISLLVASTLVMQRLVSTLESQRHWRSGWLFQMYSHPIFQVVQCIAAEAHETFM
jgi:hypothetical protein